MDHRRSTRILSKKRKSYRQSTSALTLHQYKLRHTSYKAVRDDS